MKRRAQTYRRNDGTGADPGGKHSRNINLHRRCKDHCSDNPEIGEVLPVLSAVRKRRNSAHDVIDVEGSADAKIPRIGASLISLETVAARESKGKP
jgi:hypothetical protein